MIRLRSHLTLADFVLMTISLVQIAMQGEVSHSPFLDQTRESKENGS